eukprot:TRINITY_DN5023_c0_g1_i2.p1 TRINITY_DN5023_c0_g1~~TRINITY_DN5023_c0_g1_i2.p1  ORF type:complete len:717 (+),score=139.53 TRINITY_DN5023_c0_g1_i2:1350-3500(+)
MGDDEALPGCVSTYVDSWKTLFQSSPGYTYDPSHNETAAITSSSNHVARRFDRVIARSSLLDGKCWTPTAASLFGTEPCLKLPSGRSVYPSDHYGVLSELSLCVPLCSMNAAATVATPATATPATSPLATFLQTCGSLSPSQKDKRDRILAELCDCVTTAMPKDEPPPVKIVPVGSSFLGVDTYESDIDCLCVSTLSRSAFFSAVLPALRRNEQFTSVQYISDALVPIIRMSVNGTRVELQYACVPQFAQVTPLENSNLKYLSLAAVDEHSLDAVSLICFKGYADNLQLEQAVPDLEKFQLLLKAVRLWAKARGIYSNKCGFLGGFAWSILAARVCQMFPNDDIEAIFAKFFAVFAAWNFAKTPVTLIGTGVVPKMDARFVVVSPAKPYRNVTRNSFRSSVAIIVDELKKAQECVGAMTWADFFRTDSERFHSYSHYVQIRVASSENLAGWIGRVESRLVFLCVQLEQLAPDVLVHPLTAPLRDPTDADPSACYFLIGLARTSQGASPESLDTLPSLQLFEQSMAKDGHGWAKKTVAMSIVVRLVSRRECVLARNPLPLTEVDLAAFAESEPEPAAAACADAAVSMEYEAVARQQRSRSRTPEPEDEPVGSGIFPCTHASTKKDKKSGHRAGPSSPETKKSRLHTSEEVYHRVKWDSSYNANEFTISYLDRFLGLMEVPFNEFDSETIPLHRVWIFKRNGETVWDRERRIDLLYHY